MLFARDKGRMCNNILQFGHVYAWSREHGRWAVSLRFCYKYQYFNICSTEYHNFFTYTAVKYLAKWGILPTVEFHQDGADYSDNERVMRQKRNVVVSGWYVRYYDLFLKYKSEIRQLFTFNKEIEEKVGAYLKQNGADNAVRLGLHIRRGDYKTWYGGRYFFDDDTYLRIVRQFVDLHKGERVAVFVCGNDPELDRDKFMHALQDVDGVTVHFPNGNPGEDLCLLSKCNYLIGAPSTFSLVASMYNNAGLYWIKDANRPLTKDSFCGFDTLFREIF